MDEKTIEIEGIMVDYPDVEHRDAWAPQKYELVNRILRAEAAGENPADLLEAMLVKAFVEGINECSSSAEG